MPGEVVSGQPPAPAVGYFGKVPTRGDFVRRRLPHAFLEPWDAWLQGAFSASKAALADAWLDCYLTSPMWRFCLSRGICGGGAAAGVLMPSVDSVGRYYPLMLAALLPEGGRHPFAFAARAETWFQAAEAALLGCLDKGFELEALNRAMESLAGMLDQAAEGPATALLSVDPDGGFCVQMAGGDPDGLCLEFYADLLDRLVADRYAAYSLWWTAGSQRVPPMLRVYGGLPPEADYTVFLCGARPTVPVQPPPST